MRQGQGQTETHTQSPGFISTNIDFWIAWGHTLEPTFRTDSKTHRTRLVSLLLFVTVKHTHARLVNPDSQSQSLPLRVNFLIHFQSGPQIIQPRARLSAAADSILGHRENWSTDFSQEESITLPSSSQQASLGLYRWTPLVQSHSV